MSFSIADTLSRFKQEWHELLDRKSVHQLCRAQGYQWRQRLFDPYKTIEVFLLQILHGNTAISHLRHLSGITFSSTAFCKARKRLPLAVFEGVVQHFISGVAKLKQKGEYWHDHRTFFIDGSSFSMPDTDELRGHFGLPAHQKTGCGFPVAHLLCLFNAGNGMVQKALANPFIHTHDMTPIVGVHPELQENDVLVADRAFCSFAHIAVLLQSDIHSVMRVFGSKMVRFQSQPGIQIKRHQRYRGRPFSNWLKKLGMQDQIVEWLKPYRCPSWMSREQYQTLPTSIVVRELKFRISQPGFRTDEVILVTTLTDPEKYPPAALAELYRQRWKAELNFRNLKITLGLDVLHCTTVDGVLKELCMFCIAYNLVCLVALHAAGKQNVEFDRISFIDALRSLRSPPDEKNYVTLIVLPTRQRKTQPRMKKRRPKPYKLLTQPRENLVLLLNQGLAP